MAVMDEFKEERESMKAKPFKARLAYFWDYHKLHVLAVAFVLFFVGDLLYSWITNKDVVFMAMLINCYPDTEQTEAFEDSISQKLGIDPDEEMITIDTSLTISGDASTDMDSTQVVAVRIAANELDVLMTDSEVFDNYISSELYYDLRDILSDEQYEYYKDSFYYTDYALIESGFYDDINLTEEDLAALDTDHHSPEGMEKPVPVGIYVDTTEDFDSCYRFKQTDEVVLGIACYTEGERLERALTFLDTITGRTE